MTPRDAAPAVAPDRDGHPASAVAPVRDGEATPRVAPERDGDLGPGLSPEPAGDLAPGLSPEPARDLAPGLSPEPARDAAPPAEPAPARDAAEPELRELGRAALARATEQASPREPDEAARPEDHNPPVDLARVAWLASVLALLVAVAILALDGYVGYAGVTLAVAVAAAINLL
jgi:hypothetical protein